MSTNEIVSNAATSKASAKVDMKVEVVVIPVSDVERCGAIRGRAVSNMGTPIVVRDFAAARQV